MVGFYNSYQAEMLKGSEMSNWFRLERCYNCSTGVRKPTKVRKQKKAAK